MDIDLTNSRSYNGTCYIGTLNIDNLKLPVQKGFIYDIQIAITYQIIPSVNYANKCATPSIKTILNTTLNNVYPPLQNNCTIYGSAEITPSNFPSLSISGVPSTQ